MIEPSNFYSEVGRLISQARHGKFTQDELARRIALTRTSVSNIEKGRQRVTLHTLVQIAESLGIPPATLIPQAGNALREKIKRALSSNRNLDCNPVKPSFPLVTEGNSW